MKLEGFEWSDELQEKMNELFDLTDKNLTENEGSPSKHVLDGAAPLIHEIAEMIKELPELKVEGAHKQEYIEADKYREEGRLPMSMRGDGYHCAICTKEVEQIGSKLCNACHERNVKLAKNMRSYINKDNRKWDKDIERDVREIEKKRHDGAC